MTQRTNPSDVDSALKDFDSLPDSAYVRQGVVARLLNCSRTTVWRMAQSGRIPQPKKLSGRVTAWNVGELRKALAAL